MEKEELIMKSEKIIYILGALYGIAMILVTIYIDLETAVCISELLGLVAVFYLISLIFRKDNKEDKKKKNKKRK